VQEITSLSPQPSVVSVRILAVEPHLSGQQLVSVTLYIYPLLARQKGFRP
jgi:hypothetical protein